MRLMGRTSCSTIRNAPSRPAGGTGMTARPSSHCSSTGSGRARTASPAANLGQGRVDDGQPVPGLQVDGLGLTSGGRGTDFEQAHRPPGPGLRAGQLVVGEERPAGGQVAGEAPAGEEQHVLGQGGGLGLVAGGGEEAPQRVDAEGVQPHRMPGGLGEQPAAPLGQRPADRPAPAARLVLAAGAARARLVATHLPVHEEGSELAQRLRARWPSGPAQQRERALGVAPVLGQLGQQGQAGGIVGLDAQPGPQVRLDGRSVASRIGPDRPQVLDARPDLSGGLRDRRGPSTQPAQCRHRSPERCQLRQQRSRRAVVDVLREMGDRVRVEGWAAPSSVAAIQVCQASSAWRAACRQQLSAPVRSWSR